MRNEKYLAEQEDMFTRLGIPYEITEDGDVVFKWIDKNKEDVTDLEKMMRTFDEVGIEFTVREHKFGFKDRHYQYLIIGAPSSKLILREETFRTEDLDRLTACDTHRHK